MTRPKLDTGPKLATEAWAAPVELLGLAVGQGEPRDISDCHFGKTATEYDRKPGIKWLSCTAK